MYTYLAIRSSGPFMQRMVMKSRTRNPIMPSAKKSFIAPCVRAVMVKHSSGQRKAISRFSSYRRLLALSGSAESEEHCYSKAAYDTIDRSSRPQTDPYVIVFGISSLSVTSQKRHEPWLRSMAKSSRNCPNLHRFRRSFTGHNPGSLSKSSPSGFAPSL